jgi:hypothetical protein
MPFAGYEDFDACVLDNQDKDNAEAYCAALEQAVKQVDENMGWKDEDEMSGQPMTFQIVPVFDEASEPVASEQSEDFHSLLVVEGVWTGDGRWIDEGSLTWRNLPLPLMGLDKTTEAHMEARLIGNITRIERAGRELHGYGSFVQSDDPDIVNLQNLVRNGELRGVSVDLDAVEYEVLIDQPSEPRMDDDGTVVMEGDDWRMRITSARLIGATVVPFPAFEEAFIESLPVLMASLAEESTASGWIMSCEPVESRGSIVASGHPIEPPVVPPSSWFDNPLLDGPTPLTVTDDGHIFGHLAVWGQCHVGFGATCVTPPSSATNYAHFLTGEILCDDGTRIPVGQVTLGTTHASHKANADQTARHYDHTGLAAADVMAGEDEFGIWIAGALRPHLEPATVRELMGADVSGDWRRIGGNLELVAVLSVNVPGFPKIRVREAEGLVASLSLSAFSGEDREPDLSGAAERIARTIGRDSEARLREALAKVRPDSVD